MDNEQLREKMVEVEGFDGGGQMDIHLTVGEVIEQLRVQGVRLILLPDLPEGSDARLVAHQEVAIAALAYAKKTDLQKASDMLGTIQDEAFATIKKAVHGDGS